MSIKICLIYLAIITIGLANDYYGGQQAFDCYIDKQKQCDSYFLACGSKSQCLDEVKSYSKCSFGGRQSQQTQDVIFNGYCFADWQKNAVHSKNLIDCLVNACDLTYNSVLSVELLQRCSLWVRSEQNLSCGLQCLQEIEGKVTKRMNNTQISEIYKQQFENQEAKLLIQLINRQCLSQEGRFRHTLAQKQSKLQQQKSQVNQQQL